MPSGVYSDCAGCSVWVGAGPPGFGCDAHAAIDKVSPAIATSLKPVLTVNFICLLLAVEVVTSVDIGALRR